MSKKIIILIAGCLILSAAIIASLYYFLKYVPDKRIENERSQRKYCQEAATNETKNRKKPSLINDGDFYETRYQMCIREEGLSD